MKLFKKIFFKKNKVTRKISCCCFLESFIFAKKKPFFFHNLRNFVFIVKMSDLKSRQEIRYVCKTRKKIEYLNLYFSIEIKKSSMALEQSSNDSQILHTAVDSRHCQSTNHTSCECAFNHN